MQLFLIGPSGSGKDTQAELISKKYNLKWVSIGKSLRERALVNDEEGRYIKSHIDTGNLLDWDHLHPVVLNELIECNKDFIWTGFPRLIEQAKHFDEIEHESKTHVDLVINLTLDDETTKNRIEYRKQTSINVRADDMAHELIQRRLQWYNESIDKVREYYNQTNRFVDVDASGDIPTVFENIQKVVNDRFHIN